LLIGRIELAANRVLERAEARQVRVEVLGVVAQLLGQLAQLFGKIDPRIRRGVVLLDPRGRLIEPLGLLLGLVAHLLALRDDVVLRVGEQQRGYQHERAESRCRALPSRQRDTESARIGAEQGTQRVAALETDEVLVDSRVRAIRVCIGVRC
jgi:hypothetical protein